MVFAYIALALFLVVWSWGMRIAFTRGDDPIARFGRKVFGRKENEREK